MAQFARPDGNLDTPIYWPTRSYTLIDEVTPDDGDYIIGAKNGSQAINFSLSGVVDPLSSTNHTVRFRAWQANKTHQRTLAVDLVQGTTVKSSYAAFNLVKGTPTQYEWTLSGAEADSITDYEDIRLRFTSGGTTSTPSASQAEVYVSWAEVEVPTPAAPDPLVYQRGIEVARTTGGSPTLVYQRGVEVAWKQAVPVSILSRSVEVAWKAQVLEGRIFVRIVEVAYKRTSTGRIYGIGHI